MRGQLFMWLLEALHDDECTVVIEALLLWHRDDGSGFEMHWNNSGAQRC